MSVAAPTNLTVTLVVKAFQLAWTNSATAGATHTVYRSRGANGLFVPIATGISSTPYTDYNVSNGETYAYKIVAVLGSLESTATNTVTLMFQGPADEYLDRLTSSDALTDQKGAVTVYAGVVLSGCGEYQRLQRLRGQATMCGK